MFAGRQAASVSCMTSGRRSRQEWREVCAPWHPGLHALKPGLQGLGAAVALPGPAGAQACRLLGVAKAWSCSDGKGHCVGARSLPPPQENAGTLTVILMAMPVSDGACHQLLAIRMAGPAVGRLLSLLPSVPWVCWAQKGAQTCWEPVVEGRGQRLMVWVGPCGPAFLAGMCLRNEGGGSVPHRQHRVCGRVRGAGPRRSSGLVDSLDADWLGPREGQGHRAVALGGRGCLSGKTYKQN